eukprot:m.194792 g.194792  ORF g.194792 m.194792 type:complete len:334 (-) comp10624_c0_seq1:923-1924(-)
MPQHSSCPGAAQLRSQARPESSGVCGRLGRVHLWLHHSRTAHRQRDESTDPREWLPQKLCCQLDADRGRHNASCRALAQSCSAQQLLCLGSNGRCQGKPAHNSSDVHGACLCSSAQKHKHKTPCNELHSDCPDCWPRHPRSPVVAHREEGCDARFPPCAASHLARPLATHRISFNCLRSISVRRRPRHWLSHLRHSAGDVRDYLLRPQRTKRRPQEPLRTPLAHLELFDPTIFAQARQDSRPSQRQDIRSGHSSSWYPALWRRHCHVQRAGRLGSAGGLSRPRLPHACGNLLLLRPHLPRHSALGRCGRCRPLQCKARPCHWQIACPRSRRRD